MQIGTAAKEQLHIESCRFQNHYIIKETGINLLPDIENTHEDNQTHTGKITESQNSNQKKNHQRPRPHCKRYSRQILIRIFSTLTQRQPTCLSSYPSLTTTRATGIIRQARTHVLLTCNSIPSKLSPFRNVDSCAILVPHAPPNPNRF